MREIIVTEKPDRLKGEVSFEERARDLQAEEARMIEQQKQEKKSAYTDFVQFNMEGYINTELMLTLADNSAATKLFWFITKHMDGYNALIASYKVFEEALGMSIPTIARGIKVLKDKGMLHIKKSGSANVYMLNPDVVWKSWGNNRKYCEFPANIVLAKSEQEQIKKDYKQQMHRVLENKNKQNEN